MPNIFGERRRFETEVSLSYVLVVAVYAIVRADVARLTMATVVFSLDVIKINA